MKRKNYLINPNFQLKFVGTLIVTNFLVALIFYGSNLYFLNLYRKSAMRIGLAPNHVFYSFLKDQYHQINFIFLVTSLITFFGIIVFGLLFSHRIAGPLYRLRVHLDNIANGSKPTEIKFRSHDFFKEIEDSYNRQLKVIMKDKNT